MSMFSPFNPSSSFLNLNWSIIMLIPMIMPTIKNMLLTRHQMMFYFPINFLTKEIKNMLSLLNQHSTKILISLMLTIMIMNLSSLLPFTFTPTSHIPISMSMALPMWLALMIFSSTITPMNMLAHMVPQSTPMVLMPFMVLIETISLLIRPLTLSIRLTANLLAGHLLIILLTSIPSVMSIIILLPLTILEIAVSMIQAYVFMTLISLYISELN